MMLAIEEYAAAWLSGKVCLHPTDTLPGLSFNPHSALGEQNFVALKSRPLDKSPISLISSWDVAARCWKPLPGSWEEVLRHLWPSSLSVIWEASDQCPKALVAKDGSCSLRMPEWSPENSWMRRLLLRLDAPFPSSSVNRSGQPAIEDWSSALAFLEDQGDKAYIPQLTQRQTEWHSQRPPAPSTLIRIAADGGWTILREGALSRDSIQRKWEQHAKRS